MDERIERQLQESLAVVTQMYRQGVLAPDDYHKCVVSLAYEFSVAGYHLRAASIIQSVPLEYFQSVQRKQMEEDGRYAYIAYTLALNLVQNGLVHLGPKVAATMPAASA
jgi:hypothetical protein